VGKATGHGTDQELQGRHTQERPARHETDKGTNENDSRSEKKRSETVREFKYLGRITSDDDDDPAVKGILKARQRWGPSLEIPRDGATAKMMGSFT
jgi:hypothetical protein